MIAALSVTDDFQGQYQAAERAYAEGGYDEAERISLSLLEELEHSVKEPGYASGLAEWEAILTLLLGHIALHGRNQPDQAIGWYQRSLAGTNQQTLHDIAEEGLKQCESMTATIAPQPTTDLLKDPFISTTSSPAPISHQATAMPWLETKTELMQNEGQEQPRDPEAIISQVDVEQEPSSDIETIINDVNVEQEPTNGTEAIIDEVDVEQESTNGTEAVIDEVDVEQEPPSSIETILDEAEIEQERLHDVTRQAEQVQDKPKVVDPTLTPKNEPIQQKDWLKNSWIRINIGNHNKNAISSNK